VKCLEFIRKLVPGIEMDQRFFRAVRFADPDRRGNARVQYPLSFVHEVLHKPTGQVGPVLELVDGDAFHFKFWVVIYPDLSDHSKERVKSFPGESVLVERSQAFLVGDQCKQAVKIQYGRGINVHFVELALIRQGVAQFIDLVV